MKISVICTVLNDKDSLPDLLASLERQTRPPDEVVIVDGGSRDGTLHWLGSYRGPLPLQVLERPGTNISQGRNAAIAVAGGEIIAATDAGVRLHAAWLAELAGPIEAEAGVEAVAGFFHPDPRSGFETALAATVLPAEEDISPSAFLPSSRSVAFTKTLWERAGRYPEWLDYCEDLVFDFRVMKLGVRFRWAPKAVVYARPRPGYRAFFRQYYRYARGDGKANIWLKRHLIRYGAYASVLLALPLGPALPALWVALLLAAAAYLHRPYQRLVPLLSGLSLRDRLLALCSVPLVRLTGDVAKMIGYPVGVWWRWRHAPSWATP